MQPPTDITKTTSMDQEYTCLSEVFSVTLRFLDDILRKCNLAPILKRSATPVIQRRNGRPQRENVGSSIRELCRAIEAETPAFEEWAALYESDCGLGGGSWEPGACKAVGNVKVVQRRYHMKRETGSLSSAARARIERGLKNADVLQNARARCPRLFDILDGSQKLKGYTDGCLFDLIVDWVRAYDQIVAEDPCWFRRDSLGSWYLWAQESHACDSILGSYSTGLAHSLADLKHSLDEKVMSAVRAATSLDNLQVVRMWDRRLQGCIRVFSPDLEPQDHCPAEHCNATETWKGSPSMLLSLNRRIESHRRGALSFKVARCQLRVIEEARDLLERKAWSKLRPVIANGFRGRCWSPTRLSTALFSRDHPSDVFWSQTLAFLKLQDDLKMRYQNPTTNANVDKVIERWFKEREDELRHAVEEDLYIVRVTVKNLEAYLGGRTSDYCVEDPMYCDASAPIGYERPQAPKK